MFALLYDLWITHYYHSTFLLPAAKYVYPTAHVVQILQYCLPLMPYSSFLYFCHHPPPDDSKALHCPLDSLIMSLHQPTTWYPKTWLFFIQKCPNVSDTWLVPSKSCAIQPIDKDNISLLSILYSVSSEVGLLSANLIMLPSTRKPFYMNRIFIIRAYKIPNKFKTYEVILPYCAGYKA